MARILVITDNEIQLAETLKILRAEKYETSSTTDSEEAAQLARQFQPDVILCDVMMPPSNGYEVLEMLRVDADTMGIPVVFMFDNDETTLLKSGEQFTPDGFIEKPVTRAALIREITILALDHGQLQGG